MISTTTLDIICRTIDGVSYCSDPVEMYVKFLLDLFVVLLFAFITYKFTTKKY